MDIVNEFSIESPPYFNIYSSKLNWINCDVFIDSSAKTDIFIQDDKKDQALNYLIFKDIKSIIPPYYSEDNGSSFKNIPIGSEVVIFSIVYDNNNYMYALKDYTVKVSNDLITLDYKKSDMKTILKTLESFE